MRKKKGLSFLLMLAMVLGLCPVRALADSGTAAYLDGTYTKTVTVSPDEDEDFIAYSLTVTATVADGRISGVSAVQDNTEAYDEDNEDYIDYALNGRTRKGVTYAGIPAQIAEKQSAEGIDAVSGATCVSNSITGAVAEILANDAVVKAADKTALNAAVEKAETLTEADYTAESWASLQRALTAAKETTAKEDADQETVDAQTKALTDAMDALAKTVDKAALYASIEKAEALTEADYTAESWTSLQNVLTEAKKALEDEAASQETVDTQTSAVNDAVDALEKSEKEKEFSGYVLMNIPYAQFYAAEGTSEVDAVTSATLNKPRTGGLAGGSYHVNADGSDITGVIYPVFAEDLSKLDADKQITDESSVDITVSNRGQTSTTTYEGKDALFEAASYSWYKLAEKPARYKKLTIAEDGSFAFGTVSGRAQTVNGVTGEVTYNGRHTYIEIPLEGTTGIETGDKVSGVILTDADGNKYGLRHVYNIWRATELGWNQDEYDLGGKTITNIRYVTQDAVIDYPVEISIKPAAGEVSAEFTDAATISLTGLPEDIENPTASVQSKVGRGETPVVIAEKAEVADGIITAADAAVNGTTYTITVVSGNYADISVTAVYEEKSEEPEEPDEPQQEYMLIDEETGEPKPEVAWSPEDGDLVIASNAPFEKFTAVLMDGEIVDPSNYTAVSGSTVVTIKADYVKGLAQGDHTVTIQSADGKASGKLTVKAQDAKQDTDDPNKDSENTDNTNTDNNKNAGTNGTGTASGSASGKTSGSASGTAAGKGTAKSANTGDETNLMLWIVLLAAAAAIGTTAVAVRRKRR